VTELPGFNSKARSETMPLITPRSLKTSYDVIIIGSGAAGGQSAYVLTLEGLKVLMLEAGGHYDPLTQTPMFQIPGDAPLRGAPTADLQGGFFDATRGGGWQIDGEPYTNASEKPERQFQWWRPRMLGGRTNHWNRNCYRNGPYDFKPCSRDGLGFDWPIAYEDIAPYYDKVEMSIGVFGATDGLENTPDSPPGCLLPAPKPRVSELLLQTAGKSLGIPVVANHRAVLTRQLDYQRLPTVLHPGNSFAQRIVREAMKQRLACFWATDCSRGCAIRANYQSTTVHLPPAMATGNLDLLPNAMAREITLGKDGRANGVTFIDTTTAHEVHACARAVVVAAGALESVRLLLNSKSTFFPDGLANSSGLLGRYITNTVGNIYGVGQVPRLEDLPLHNEDGASPGHVYIPWWLYKENLADKLDFPRGYHIEVVGGRQMPSLDIGIGMESLTHGGYGRKFKDEMRRYYGSFVYFDGLGEMIPNNDCYCELDPKVKDKWGIPVLRFHWKWSQHEIRQAAHMRTTFAALVDAMGGRLGRISSSPTGDAEIDFSIGASKSTQPDKSEVLRNDFPTPHEVGGAMMGFDPARSVTNGWSQAHDVPNLVLADGATFVSHSSKSPTLTIMALAWRAAEHLTAELKKGNLR
jgi:choline dehydrogenase-like flavoprotein